MGGYTEASVTRGDQEKQQEGTQRGETVSGRDDEIMMAIISYIIQAPAI